MTKYQCNKGHLFIHPAKIVTVGLPKEQLSFLTDFLDEAPKDEALSPLIEMLSKLKDAFNLSSFEKYACPECRSIHFTEYTEPDPVADSLEDMQLVEFKDVTTYILKGYVELDRKDHVFAKGIIMLKTKPKFVNPDPDANEAIIEANQP